MWSRGSKNQSPQKYLRYIQVRSRELCRSIAKVHNDFTCQSVNYFDPSAAYGVQDELNQESAKIQG